MISPDLFWEMTNKDAPNGCWEWAGPWYSTGYGRIGEHLAHRTAYELVNGPIDDGQLIDHICHNIKCVNPEHLRACTHAENIRNSKLRSNNKSGFKGVSWHKGARRWRSTIVVDGKQHHLGFYEDLKDAHAAYCHAALRLHGDFANFGEAA